MSQFVTIQEQLPLGLKKRCGVHRKKMWDELFDMTMQHLYKYYQFSYGGVLYRMLYFDKPDLAGTEKDRLIDPNDRAFWINWSLERAIKFMNITRHKYWAKYQTGIFGRIEDPFFESTPMVMLFDSSDIYKLLKEKKAISYSEAPHTDIIRLHKVFPDLEIMVYDRDYVPKPAIVVMSATGPQPDMDLGMSSKYKSILEEEYPDTTFLMIKPAENNTAWLPYINARKVSGGVTSGEEGRPYYTYSVAKTVLNYLGVN